MQAIRLASAFPPTDSMIKPSAVRRVNSAMNRVTPTAMKMASGRVSRCPTPTAL
jgi:hypothetical protein